MAEDGDTGDVGDGDEDEVSLDPDDVAEELYGLPRDDFIPERDARVKAARAAGDRDAASEIAALRKPSLAAWLANLLARDRPDEIGALEDLGTSMREAQDRLEGDALRALSRQRHELVAALVQRGRRIAREEGVKVGESVLRELEQSVSAALTDPGAARAFAEGRLTTALEPGAGFDATPARARTGSGASARASSTATRPTRGRPARRPDRDDAHPPTEAGKKAGPGKGGAASAQERAEAERREREQAEADRRERERAARERELRRALDDARAAAERARDAAVRADEVAREAERAQDEAAADVRDLEARLERARAESERAADRAREAGTERDAREAEAREAAQARDTASRALAEHEAEADDDGADDGDEAAGDRGDGE